MSATPATAPVAELDACPHPRGPGISVCLRCRAEANQRAAASRRRFAVRGGAGLLLAGAALVAGNSAMTARGATVTRAGAAAPQDERLAERFTVTQASASEARPAPAESAASALPALPRPLVVEGRTELGDGRWVERQGDSIAVHFDTPAYRTRRRDKFEETVRATLPRVYGPIADDALGQVPVGELAALGDLLTDLPQQGIRLPVRDGRALTLWPVTRPGQDGPLVVTYRVSLTRVP